VWATTPPGPDEAGEIVVQPTNGVLRKPVQGRGGQRGVNPTVGQLADPAGVAQVGLHDLHAMLIDEARRCDGEQHRVDIDGDGACSGQSVE
jgi:hypothetical protein